MTKEPVDENYINQYNLNTWFSKVNSKLSIPDKNSLLQTMRQIKDFGNDFPLYRETELRGVPNIVLFYTLQFLKKKAKMDFFVSREMSRYNIILTSIVQQFWKSQLEPIFKCIKFYSLKKVPQTTNKINLINPEQFYQELLLNLSSFTGSKLIAHIIGYENTPLSYIATIQTDNIQAILTFKKSPLNKLDVVCSNINGVFQFSNSESPNKFDTSNDENSNEELIQMPPQYVVKPPSPLQNKLMLPLLSMDDLGPYKEVEGTKYYF